MSKKQERELSDKRQVMSDEQEEKRGHSSLITYHSSLITHLFRPPEPVNARSTEAFPPPEMSNAKVIARSARGYSMPRFEAKKLGQCTPMIAVSIVQAIKKAPTRVSNPRKTSIPPMSSESAAAPSHSQAGRINPKGAGPDTQALRPLPPRLPNTFCEP